MRILIDIGHPAHVHLFKHFAWEMQNRRHKIVITVRFIESAIKLLDYYGFSYSILGNKYDNIYQKGLSQLKYDYEIYKILKKERIDFAIGTPFNIAHASKLNKTISIILDDDDDDVQPLMVFFGHPFADCLLSPDPLYGSRRNRGTIYYAGYHELFYLHPNRLVIENDVLKTAKIKEDEKYFILRFNSFKAHHDIGIHGLSGENKKELVKFLSQYGKIYITSEREIEPQFEKYKITIPSYKIHSFIAHSTMLIGDSQTMTSEAAILGIPALKCNNFAGKLSVPNELEYKYQLCYSFLPADFDKMLLKIEELLKTSDLKKEWQRRRQQMLAEKIDVTAFLVWFVENYPDSFRIMKENPDYQFRFR